MKKLYLKAIIHKFIITVLVLNVFVVEAQVRKAFTQRTSTYSPTKKIYNVQGDFTMLGNTNLSPQNYSPTTNNNGQNMQYVDVDGDATTMNSSSATLALSTENGASPDCSKIIYAGLYWTGATSPNSTFSVTKQVKNGGTQTINNNNLTFGHGNNLTNTNYSLSISRNGSTGNRNPIYTFSGNGKTYAFSFYNSDATNRITLTTTGLTTNLTNSPIAATINSAQTEATLTTPYVINDGTINITITKLIRSADANLNTGTTQSTSTVLVNINGTTPTYVSLTKTFDKRKISLKGPNANSYTQFTAATTDIYYPSNTDDNLFSAYVEVTDYVKTNGIGAYLAADIALLEGDPGGTGYSGGWGMIVVYENSKMKYRDVTIFDGYAYVSSGNGSGIQLPVSGFNTVQTGNVGIKLGVMASEGDVSYNGDFFKIQKLNSTDYLELNNKDNADGTPNTTPITNSNFFNSTIIAGGPKNPDLVNNTGIDINMFKVPNPGNTVIANNQTSTNFQYGTGNDTYSIFTIAMSVDAYIPVVDAIISPISVNGTPVNSGTISVLPGDILNVKVDITNRGTEAVNNTKIIIPIPYTADFVNGSLTKNINFTPLPSPNSYYFNPALGPKGSIVFDLGTLPLPANPNTVLANFSFNVKTTTDCAILKNSLCNQNTSISGLISGTGAITGVNFSDKALYIGYTSNGNCADEPILNPLIININSTDYVTNNCLDTNAREFVYCTSNPTIPVTDISGGFPPGSLFY
ncbi:MAG: hypothetical protein KA210_13430, partial [Bacteroidia bacterium]|nr:hypothetical protein [Bacteroidia bacterium]